jgi:hypothetical protein
MDRQHHWDTVYKKKGEHDVSWFEPLPAISTQLLESAGLTSKT